MARPLIFSTGNMYHVYRSINEKLASSLKFDVDGIEVLLGTASEVRSFKLTSALRKQMRQLEFNTIHLPFAESKSRRYMYFWNTPLCKAVFKKVQRIYDDIGAINSNMHSHQLKNEKLLEGMKMNFTFENLTEGYGFSINDYKILFKEHPDFGMLLDTSHGIRTGQLRQLVSNFKNRIRFVHFSGAKGPKDDHYLVHKFEHPNRKMLDVVKQLKCPVIIEAGRERGLTMQDFRNEVEYMRRWLR